jgi:hypothetical protein
MNLALLLPAGLAALAALLVPLLLHLARRSERRPLDFAALRWLSARARPRRHVRFDEIPLLLLRMLLLAALALLLARPVLEDAVDATPWVVAMPGVPVAEIDAVAAEGARRHWLAPGFPAVDAERPTTPQGAVPAASLLRELDVRVPAAAPLTILVPPVFDGADAERPRLSRAVDWRIVGATTRATRAAAVTPMPQLVVRHDAGGAEGVRYLRAAAAAWGAVAAPAAGAPDAGAGATATPAPASAPVEVADVSAALPADARLVAWLAAGPVPDPVLERIRGGGTLLLDARAEHRPATPGAIAMRDRGGRVLMRAQRMGRGRVLQWTAPLVPDAMPALLEPDFPQRLRAAVLPPPAPRRADARHYAPATGATPWPLPPRGLAPWLALLVAVLFLVERWWANGPRRGAST